MSRRLAAANLAALGAISVLALVLHFTRASGFDLPAASLAAVQTPPCTTVEVCATAVSCATHFPELGRLVGLTDAEVRGRSSTHSMIGLVRLATNIAVVSYVTALGIPGDLVEAGVARGGSAASLFLAAAARGHARPLHLFDTFVGMPPPEAIDTTEALKWVGKIKHSQGEVGAYLTSVGVPHGLTIFHVGDIVATPADALPCAVSVLRLDTDWHASYVWALERMYPLVSPGGIILLDDYRDWIGARKAVGAFLAVNPTVRLNMTTPPMLCKPLADGSASPCGLEELAAASAAARAGRASEHDRGESALRWPAVTVALLGAHAAGGT